MQVDVKVSHQCLPAICMAGFRYPEGGRGLPFFDFDSRSVTETQGLFFFLPVISRATQQNFAIQNLDHAHMWVWLVAPHHFENPGSCPVNSITVVTYYRDQSHSV